MGLFQRLAGLVQDLNISNFNLLNLKALTWKQIIAVSGSGGTVNIDWTAGLKYVITMTANTTFTFTAPTGISQPQLLIVQGGSGSYVPTLPTIKWTGGSVPTWSTAVGAVDIVSLLYTGGTTYYAISSPF